jgi:PAS domain S-box-containing protein
MSDPLRLLIIEDSEDDVVFLLRALRRNNFTPTWECVKTSEAFRTLLATQTWDAIVSDYHLPGFEASEALEIFKQSQLDIPFIVVSGTISEQSAADMMKAGARDYLMKDNLTRLPEVIRRELREVRIRAERKQAEMALIQSEAKNRAILAAIPDLMFRVGADGIYRELITSRSKIDLFFSDREPIGLAMPDVLPPEIAKQHLRYLEQVLRTGELQRYEHQVRTGDRLHDEEVRVVKSGSDEALFMIRDISDRKQAEEQLQQLNQELEAKVKERTAALEEREARYRALMNGAGDAILVADIQGNLLEVNRKAEKLFGYPRERLTQMRQFQLHPPEDVEQVTAVFLGVVQSQRTQVADARILRQDGERVNVSISATMVNIGDTSIVQSIFRDITERKQAEQIIHQQVEQETLLREIGQKIRQSLNLQTIFDTASQEIRSVIQADRVGIFKFFPDSNFSEGEFVAESVVERFPSVVKIRVRDRCFGDDYAALYTQGRFHVINNIDRSGLTDCHIDVLARFKVRAGLVMPLLCGDRLWGLLCIHQCESPRHWQQSEINLTQQIANQLAIAIQQANLFEQLQQELRERQKTQQQLTQRNQQLAVFNEELARATRLKDEFLANMSHELRTPLNAILGMTEGLQDEVFGRIGNEQENALKSIERSASHLLELINDILDVAKIESGQIELERRLANLKILCKSSLTFIKQAALKKRIHLEMKLPQNLPELFIDERRIRQVLINLLNNAVKFTPQEGRITLEVNEKQGDRDSSPRDASAQNYLQIAVRDTGIGIDPEHQSKLFQPFVQIDSALNRQYTGTGLGLALVKRIVELHDGQVALTSEIGKGSCFTITLPCGISPSDSCSKTPPSSSGSDRSDRPDATERSPLILLAEDNEANITTVSSYLKARGYRLSIAKNGAEAIALTRSQNPDLILMDIQMPEMDGLEAMQHIRCDLEREDLPIIALTALAMNGDRDRCLAAGANDYLSKPFKLKQLVNAIHQLLVSEENAP